jgi:HK97 gp10 family phage protein
MIEIDAQSQSAVLKLRNLDRLTRSGIEHASWMSGRQLIRATSQEILRRPKGGRTYVRRTSGGSRRRHVASAPGETHANMTGTLRRSLSFSVNPSQLEFGYGVRRNDAPDYAEFVEFGTSRMRARPSLQNGIRSQRRNFQANFDREIGKRLEGRGF